VFDQSPPSALVPSGEWVHVAGRWDNGSNAIAIFVNGQKTQTAATITSILNSTANLRVGGDAGGRMLNGRISNAWIAASAISDEQIMQLYRQGPGSPW